LELLVLKVGKELRDLLVLRVLLVLKVRQVYKDQ
jgi:hypothetical protein